MKDFTLLLQSNSELTCKKVTYIRKKNAFMTLVEFKASPVAKKILLGLAEVRDEFSENLTPEDLLSASFFCYLGASGEVDLSESIKKQLAPYIKRYKAILSQILVNYLGVSESDFFRWSAKIYSSTNALTLSQQCGMLTPTNALNKDLIH